MNSSCDHLALAVRNSSVVFAAQAGANAVRDCFLTVRETLFSSLPLHFISPPPTSAECFNLSEDPGVSAVVVAGVGFFTSAGPVWEKALLGI